MQGAPQKCETAVARLRLVQSALQYGAINRLGALRLCWKASPFHSSCPKYANEVAAKPWQAFHLHRSVT